MEKNKTSERISLSQLRDDTLMKRSAERLLEVTEGCRPDMHEPDEQDLSARVLGDHLDNAMGEQIRGTAVEGGYQELVVIFKRGVPGSDGDYSKPFTIKEIINLATLTALARFGAQTILGEGSDDHEVTEPNTHCSVCLREDYDPNPEEMEDWQRWVCVKCENGLTRHD